MFIYKKGSIGSLTRLILLCNRVICTPIDSATMYGRSLWRTPTSSLNKSKLPLKRSRSLLVTPNVLVNSRHGQLSTSMIHAHTQPTIHTLPPPPPPPPATTHTPFIPSHINLSTHHVQLLIRYLTFFRHHHLVFKALIDSIKVSRYDL